MSVVFNADPGLSSEAPSPIVYDIKTEVVSALNDFYHNHVEGSLQIFHSLTLGEIMISVILVAIFLLLTARWIWEAVRYG